MATNGRAKRVTSLALGVIACSLAIVSPAAAHKRGHAVHRPSLALRHHETPVRHETFAHPHLASHHLASHHLASHHRLASHRRAYRHYASYRHSWLQCVPYARAVSHVELTGNAFIWWAEAAGRYARGHVPAQGAVLDFRSERRMPLGHVAVVTSVIDSRTILVTQANWVPGTITNDVQVQDVSPDNDWSQVQVQLGDRNAWGSTYSTYGFIYNRPAAGTVVADTNSAATADEVAEAPKVAPIGSDGPNRNLQ